MTCEEYALIKGPLDGATFSLERDDVLGTDSIIVPTGQESLWQVASFDEGGAFVRFLVGELDSTVWFIYQYKYETSGRYIYAGILIRSDGRSKTQDVISRLKGENHGEE